MAETEGGKVPDLSSAMVTEPVAALDWLVIAPCIITIMGGAVLLMARRKGSLQPVLAVAIMALLVAATGGLLAHVWLNGPVAMTMGRWLPPFGITFTADVLGAGLAFVSSLAALGTCLYAAAEIDGEESLYGFYSFMALMMAGVCGAFLTGDIFNLYVWFEVLLIASFGLIVLGNRVAQLDGALKYAVLNLIATTLFLIATGYLYGVLGTLNMADIATQLRQGRPDAPLATIGALYILAFAMKAAAFPVNFWLPASYHTPHIAVSAIFGGLLTKVGVYALLRITVLLMPNTRELYGELLVAVAIATMLVGSLGALAHADVRRLLGYLVISGIGLMLAGLALATPIGLAGAIVYAIHSIIVITALYLVVGLAGRMNGGAFDLSRMGGLYGASPLLAALALILVFAISGLPPFSGFWPKAILTQAAILERRWLLAAMILITGFLSTIAAGRFFIQAFWRGGPAPNTPDGAERSVARVIEGTGRTWYFGSVIMLVAITVALGLVPGLYLAIGDRGAFGLLEPTAYIDSVFGEAR